jgi:hypothetical protein
MRSRRWIAVLLAPAAGAALGYAIAVSPIPDVLDRWDRARRARAREVGRA